MRRRQCLGLVAVTLLVVAIGQVPRAGAAPRPRPVPPPVTTQSVTLITGDTVQVQAVPGGRQVATLEPGQGREHVGFQQTEVDHHLLVIPLDALPYVGAKRVDRALFDVTELLAEGYGDQQTRTLPLIVSYRPGIRAASALPAATTGPSLASINGLAVAESKADAEQFWNSLTGPAVQLDGGVEHVWLDRKVKASLDRSVPQIGAPAAWGRGYDGRGVQVAVLDTGVDATHPDLAGVIAETHNFSDSATTEDKVGHGTHVAATIAGSGAGFGGKRKGVAPGAKLLIGKVLDDDGFGFESWILAGMDWAAHSGARVVNLSLGADPTDGTDPMSAGLDALTASTGTLFVVAAGNDGQRGDFTVGTPGAASTALTVGAVDRANALAPFSSRGPRVGDFAIKPDITAPGVGIVAARASGTVLGDPVDELYTSLSGTSMATPHVAGAAAIIAQQHPDWNAQQLKDALVSTARRTSGLTTFEQGGGRVDLDRATAQPIAATGTLDLGDVAAEAQSPFTKVVTYGNASTHSVSLQLRLDVRGPHGALPREAIRLDATRLTVAAGATVTVRLRIDPARLDRGRYSGYLEASAGATVVHTSLGLTKEAPVRRVTFTGIGASGSPELVMPLTVFGADPRFDFVGLVPAGSPLTLSLADGTYFLHGVLNDGVAPDEHYYVVDDPLLRINGDRTVVLDARKAHKVEIQTPEPARQDGILSFYSHREFPGRSISHFQMEFDTVGSVYAAPTGRVSGRGESYEFGTRWQLVKPRLTIRAGTDELRPFFLNASPLLDGRRDLRLVDVGAGTPADYLGQDVRGRAVLVTAPDEDYEPLVHDAAAAGAALALISVPAETTPWTVWSPAGERLPTMGVLISRDSGTALAERLNGHRVDLHLDGTPSSPYLYDVLQVAHDQVPQHIVYRVGPRNSATVDTSYAESGGLDWQKEQRFAWRPWQDTAINQYQRMMHTPAVRREIVTAGDTIWQHKVRAFFSLDSLNPLQGGMNDAPRTYRPGEHRRETWFAPLAHPAIPTGVDGLTSYRFGDTLRIRIPEWSDGGAGHYGYAEGDWTLADTVTAQFYRDGQLVADGDAAWGDFPAVAGPATYRMDLRVGRVSPEWEFGTRTDTSWTFRSARPATPALLPLLQLDYAVPVDLSDRAPAGRAFSFDVAARHQDGLTGPRIGGLDVAVSYDDGASWSTATVRPRGDGRYRISVVHPPLGRTNGFVTMRVSARDNAGDTVQQTIVRAYGLR